MNTRNTKKSNSINELTRSKGFIQFDHYHKDQVTKKMIQCCNGFTFQEVLDQLEYTKDFLFNRVIMRDIDYSAIDEEYEKHKKNAKSGC